MPANQARYREYNFDGLVGPTHNYGGLSLGNVASMAHEGRASNPRLAALEGLQKMRFVHALGV
jgi:succinylarginine dihydrolase